MNNNNKITKWHENKECLCERCERRSTCIMTKNHNRVYGECDWFETIDETHKN